MNEYVSLQGLKNISITLDRRREELKEIYEEYLLPLLEESKNLYGINTLGYDQLFRGINSKLSYLSSLLEGDISHNYEELIDNLKGLFNNGFNDKFNEIMDNNEQ